MKTSLFSLLSGLGGPDGLPGFGFGGIGIGEPIIVNPTDPESLAKLAGSMLPEELTGGGTHLEDQIFGHTKAYRAAVRRFSGNVEAVKGKASAASFLKRTAEFEFLKDPRLLENAMRQLQGGIPKGKSIRGLTSIVASLMSIQHMDLSRLPGMADVVGKDLDVDVENLKGPHGELQAHRDRAIAELTKLVGSTADAFKLPEVPPLVTLEEVKQEGSKNVDLLLAKVKEVYSPNQKPSAAKAKRSTRRASKPSTTRK